MAVAKRDENSRTTIICASKNDGITIVPITANPGTHHLNCSDGTTGSDNGNNSGNAILDENNVAVWMAESSADDGSLIEVYADPVSQVLLIDSQ